MTKKDFELIAETLRYCDSHADSDDARWVAEHLANALANTNPRFDRGRFLDAALSPQTRPLAV